MEINYWVLVMCAAIGSLIGTIIGRMVSEFVIRRWFK